MKSEFWNQGLLAPYKAPETETSVTVTKLSQKQDPFHSGSPPNTETTGLLEQYLKNSLKGCVHTAASCAWIQTRSLWFHTVGYAWLASWWWWKRCISDVLMVLSWNPFAFCLFFYWISFSPLVLRPWTCFLLGNTNKLYDSGSNTELEILCNEIRIGTEMRGNLIRR